MNTGVLSAPTNSLSTTSALEGQAPDGALVAVIQGKPRNDQIPTAVWWFMADCLEHSVTTRRAIDGAATLPRHSFHLTVKRARLAAEAALDELDQPLTNNGFDAATAEPPSLHKSIRDLARLVVTPRLTPTVVLCQAINAHLAALAISDKTVPLLDT